MLWESVAFSLLSLHNKYSMVPTTTPLPFLSTHFLPSTSCASPIPLPAPPSTVFILYTTILPPLCLLSHTHPFAHCTTHPREYHVQFHPYFYCYPPSPTHTHITLPTRIHPAESIIHNFPLISTATLSLPTPSILCLFSHTPPTEYLISFPLTQHNTSSPSPPTHLLPQAKTQ